MNIRHLYFLIFLYVLVAILNAIAAVISFSSGHIVSGWLFLMASVLWVISLIFLVLNDS